MMKRKTIWQVLHVLLWIAVGSGVTMMLMGAVSEEKSVKCARVQISFSGDSAVQMITEEEIFAALWPSAADKPVGKRVVDFDLFALEKQLEKNPWVFDADVFFDHHRNMHVSITQRKPVARLFTPEGSSIYLDEFGKTMPLKSSDVIELPVFTNYTLRASQLNASDSLLMNRIVGLSKYVLADDFWMAQLEAIHIHYDNSFELSMQVGDQTVLLGTRDDWEHLFPKLKLVYARFAADNSWGKYSSINLQFKDQVVCKRIGGYEVVADSSITSVKTTVQDHHQ
jgi:cell division protein FtsQ